MGSSEGYWNPMGSNAVGPGIGSPLESIQNHRDSLAFYEIQGYRGAVEFFGVHWGL